MNMNSMRWTQIAAVVGVITLAGCSSNQAKTEAPAPTAEVKTPAAAHSGETERGEAAGAITQAATVAGMWVQIEDEQSKLATVIQNGELKDVHHLAFGIRDLVVALAGKAIADSPGSAPQFNGMADKVSVMASKLDELGDAGDLSGTQAEFAKLETYLNGIKTVTGAK